MEVDRLCPHCMGEMPEGEKTLCPHCGYDLKNPREITHQLKPFSILEGKYLVGDVLGEGGFGITYIGFDLNLEIKIAIKEFYPNGFATREAQHTSELTAYAGQSMETVYKWRDDFVKEARSLAKCSHLPGIVGVKDYFHENNTAYIIMEYLEGQTLKEHMKAGGGKLPADDVLRLMRPVISSLAEVHKEGLIHRDISPDNLILLKGGTVKLLDFGAARNYNDSGEKSLSVMLKPGYAPEEQYRTKGKQGPWSDVYALCATIYKCITGITPPESMERMRNDELKKISSLGISISPQVEAALEKGMAVFAENRCQSMAELEKLLYGPGTAAPAPVTASAAVPAEKTAPAEKAASTDNVPTVKGQLKNSRNVLLAAAGIIAALVAVIAVSGNKSDKITGDEKSIPVQTAEDSADGIQTEEIVQPTEAAPATENSTEETASETEEASVEHTYRYVVRDCTWTEAYMECKESGGHLVTFDSPEEYEEILTAIERQGLGDYRFYIGGMRESDSYDYHWIEEGGDSYTVLNSGYWEYWMTGEPSYVDGEETIENYMMIFRYDDDDDGIDEWVWNDVPNDVISVAPYYAGKMGYICEYEGASQESADVAASVMKGNNVSTQAEKIDVWMNQSLSTDYVEFGQTDVGMPLYVGSMYKGMPVSAEVFMSADGLFYSYMDNQLCYTSFHRTVGSYEYYFFNGELIKVVFGSFSEKDNPSYVREYGELTAEDRQSVQWYLQEGEKIRRMFSPDEYILPDADCTYISREELESMKKEELRYIRNEIYARHGYIFEDDTLRAYFMGKSWYSPQTVEVSDSMLNEYEKANRDLIVQIEQE